MFEKYSNLLEASQLDTGVLEYVCYNFKRIVQFITKQDAEMGETGKRQRFKQVTAVKKSIRNTALACLSLSSNYIYHHLNIYIE